MIFAKITLRLFIASAYVGLLAWHAPSLALENTEIRNTHIEAKQIAVLGKINDALLTQCEEGLETLTTLILDPDASKQILIAGNQDKAALDFIRKNLSGYRVQVYVDGPDTLQFNALLAASGDFPSWKKKPVLVKDGGPRFWHASYDVKTKRFTTFWINGGA